MHVRGQALDLRESITAYFILEAKNDHFGLIKLTSRNELSQQADVGTSEVGRNGLAMNRKFWEYDRGTAQISGAPA
jgi:hypothetical protein